MISLERSRDLNIDHPLDRLNRGTGACGITQVTSSHYFSVFFIPSRLKFLRMTVLDSGDFSSPSDDAERAGTAVVCLHLNTFTLEAEK